MFSLSIITAGGPLSYLILFLAIILSGHLVPLPEDAVLFLAGYVASFHNSPFAFTILLVICMIGPLFGDAILYYIARGGGRYFKWFEPHIKSSVFNKISHHMHKNTVRTIFFSRFVPGVRLASPLVAGTLKVDQKLFLWASLLGSIFYGGIFFYLGYIFHSYLPQFFHVAKAIRHTLFGLFPFAIITVIAFYMYQKVSDN